MVRFFVLLVVLGSSSMSSAQSHGAQAEVLFRQGRELMTAGKYAEACASFDKSQQLEPAVTTLLNLAGCREKNGQLATAWGLFLEAERQTRSLTDNAGIKLHDVAKQRAQTLEQSLSKLTISVPEKSAVSGLEIKRNGETVDSVMWNRALPIDGGTYTITAHAPGANEWSTQVTIGATRDTKSVDVPDLRNREPDLTAKPSPVQPPPPPRPVIVHAHRSNVLPIAVGAGGVALVGAAIAFELSARGSYDDAKAEMTNQAERDSLEDSANTKRYVAQGLGVAGVACAGVAVWLYLRPSAKNDDRVGHRHVVVSPTGIAILGTF